MLFMRLAVSSYFEKFFPLILKVSAMHIKEKSQGTRAISANQLRLRYDFQHHRNVEIGDSELIEQ